MREELYIKSLTDNQLVRFHFRIWKQINEGMGYQPYGWDWPTLRIVHPHFAKILKGIFREHNARTI